MFGSPPGPIFLRRLADLDSLDAQRAVVREFVVVVVPAAVLYHGAGYVVHRERVGMLRRHRAFPRLTMACIGTLLALPSPAIAARGEPPTPEKLWKAFPLNPTGERIETTQRVETQRPVTPPDAPRHERPFVPPTTEAIQETSGPASDGNPRLLALVATALVLLGAGLLALRLRRADHSRSPRANEGGSARLLALPAIGLVVLYALYGYGIYTLVSTLVHLL